MGQTIIAERDQVNVPLGVEVSRDGGITGLTVTMRIYNGDDVTEFLDFNDGVFKSAGHTTPTQDLTPVGLGLYAVDGGFDLSGITVPASASSLLAQFDITAGGETGTDVDTIQLVDEFISIADKATLDSVSSSVALVETEASAATREATNTSEHSASLVAIGLNESEASALSRANTNQTEHDDTQTAIGLLNDLSEAEIQSAMDSQGYTVARATLLDNLDTAISTATTSILTAIGLLNDLSEADVQSAMDTQGYTTARAALLDNLDAAVSLVRDHARAANSQTQPLP